MITSFEPTDSTGMLYAPRVLDLFCGAGGLSLGFRQAGCEVIGGIDNEHWPIETHHRNFPDCKLKLPPTDIQKIEPASLGIAAGSIDILIGGPPCQGFSQVGQAKIRSLGQERQRDQKNRLYREFIRFLDYFQPTYFVIENVQGMKNFKKSSFLDKIRSELANGIDGKGYSFRAGYDVEFRVLCARDFGVPQVRNRLFIIGRRRDRSTHEIRFPEPCTERPITLKDAIGDLASLKAPVLKTRRGTLINSGVQQCDRPKKYRMPPANSYQLLMRKESPVSVLNHLCRGHNEKDLEIFSHLKQGQKYLDLPVRYRRYRDDIFDDKYRKLKANEPSWTLTAHMQKDCLAFIHPTQTRTLSAREAARIQSFPDHYVFLGPLTKLFRMIGNAVPPILAERVAEGLVFEIRKQKTIVGYGRVRRA